jgi:hypothetical protein
VITAYFDASAILKLTLAERESLDLIDYLSDRDVRVATSVVAEVEVMRTLQRVGVAREEQDSALGKVYLLSLDSDVRREALRLQPRSLRALDAIHVASAVSIADRNLEFVTYDGRMADAARTAGLKVISPGRDQNPTV